MSPNGAPVEERWRFQSLSLHIPSKGALPSGFPCRAPTHRERETRCVKIVFQSAWCTRPLQFPQCGHMEKGAHFQSLLCISSAVPSEQGRLKRQNVTFLSKSLLRVLPLWSANRPPVESSLFSEPAFTYFSESPVEEPSVQVPLTVVPLRMMLSFHSPLCPSLKVPSKCPPPP